MSTKRPRPEQELFSGQNETALPDPKVVIAPTAVLREYPRNPRKHTERQVRQLVDSFRRFGVMNPIIVDAQFQIVCGHGRYKAAKRLGLKNLPVIKVEHLTEAELKAYRLADNKIAQNATWDDELVRIELNDIADLDVSFDLELTGFDAGEIDIIVENEEPNEAETVPAPDRHAPATCHEGDLWIVGPHRLFCGDCRSAASWRTLLASNLAQMVFTDPPYNVRISGNVSGLGRTAHREFAMASGEMSKTEYTSFLRTVFEFLVENSCETAIHYVCIDWRHMREVLDASDGVYHEHKNLCVWAKTNAGMGSYYRSQHELIFVFKCGDGPHINNFGLGERGRHRSNLWTYAGANTFREGRAEDLAAHPTVKPIAMVRDAILDCSKRGGIILDPFAGAGTTLIAASRTGRRGFGMEIDPHYADLILRRLEAEIGEPAVLAETGETFGDARRRRLEETDDV